MSITFLIYWLVNAAFIALLFEASQRISVAAGQIPPRGIHVWKGKPFLHWNDFACQKFGDLIFISGLAAAVFVATSRIRSTMGSWIFLAATFVLAIVATILWSSSVKKQFAAGKFNRWDWGFTAPSGELTFAGRVHNVYFNVASLIIGYMFYLLRQPIGLWIRVFMVACVVGYTITVIYDARKIGMSGGPFGVSGPTKDK